MEVKKEEKDKKRDKVIQMSCSQEEVDRITNVSEKLGLSTSSYCRFIILQSLVGKE